MQPASVLDLSSLLLPKKEHLKAIELVGFIQQLHADIKKKIEASNAKYKAQADKKKRQVIFKEGDLGVFVVVRWAIAMGLGWVVAVGLGWVSGVLLWVYRYEVVGVYRVRNIASAGSEIRDVMQPFPNEVFDLDRSLHILDLTHSKIVDIPLDISKLIKMQHLISAKNLVQQLPTNLGTLHCLKLIALDGIQMTSLPAEIGQLVMLERLSISGNLLTCLPKTIGSLRNLLLLDVSNNKLKSLPESIGSCFSLEELQANDNLIEDLPASICNLIHLKSLCLDNNNVNQDFASQKESSAIF
ncbi:plant intracellular Ras-group-related LRR protein 7-like [Quercus lobata]|uniref:plant intracellular Ras-group-related LRR protein 7-like n=1 Tax=Quercus lobata TaxID=97700 RepID=UPI001244B1CB|nr:plant intracellular Ras-group-related LRR protein 7-like [Quercus lobata]